MAATPQPDLFSPIELEALRLDEELTIPEWMDRYLYLPREDHPQAGPYHTNRTPYARGIGETISDPTTTIIDWVASRQVGKTVMMTGVDGFYCDQQPTPILHTMPTEDAVKAYADNRFRHHVEQSEGFQRNVPASRNAMRGMIKQFVSNSLYFAWAGSIASVVSTPIGVCILDELDLYPASAEGQVDPAEAAIETTTNFPGRKIIRASTPSLASTGIWQAFLTSLQHLFFVPCPHCGRYQVLTFRGTREGKDAERLGEHYGVTWPADCRDRHRIAAEQLAWYECRYCAGRIPNHQKPWLLLRGLWLPIIQDRKNPYAWDDTLAQEFLSLYAKPIADACASDTPSAILGGRTAHHARRLLDPDGTIEWADPWSTHVGFRLDGLYSPFDGRSWWAFAAKFLETKEFPIQLKVFRQHWQGLPWLQKTIELSDELLRKYIGTHTMGVVPKGTRVLTAGVDVHDYRYVLGVYGWGDDDRLPLIYCTEVDTWDAVVEVLFRSAWSIEQATPDTLHVTMAFVDTGWNTAVEYDHVREWPDRCRAIKGVTGTAMAGAPWRIRKIEHSPHTGKPYPGGLPLVLLNVDMLKDELVLRRLTVDPGQPGSVIFPVDVPDWWLAGLTAEQKVPHVNRRTGQATEEWIVVDGKPNHPLDATVYGLAAGNFIGATRLRPGTQPPRQTHHARTRRPWHGVRKQKRRR